MLISSKHTYTSTLASILCLKYLSFYRTPLKKCYLKHVSLIKKEYYYNLIFLLVKTKKITTEIFTILSRKKF